MEQINIEDIEKWLGNEEVELVKNGKLVGKLIPNEPIMTRNVKTIVNEPTKYFVPAYQRGYCWTEKQVNDLLEDILIWGEKKNKGKYSLQPIVIKKQADTEYTDLIDGQQRLTTIYLILKAIGKPVNYSLNYETRANSEEFLKDIENRLSEKNTNIDYYHFVQTFEIAKKYFLDSAKAEKWYQYLLNENNGAFFIEYSAVNDSRSDEEIFTGLNAGKIPLTNAELVKGLFLKRNNFEANYLNRLIEISQEWDRIERRLHEKSFWSWLGQDDTDKPRIDFVLSLVANSEGTETFKYFQEKIVSDTVEKVWYEVKQCFMTLEDWYDDWKIYHLMGYINVVNQKAFLRVYHDYISEDIDLVKYISNLPELKNFDISSYQYGDKNTKKVLLLFNLLTCVDDKVKFDFKNFDYKGYDVEHIFPHSEFERIDSGKRKEYYQTIKESHLFDEVTQQYDDTNIENDEIFKKFYQAVIGDYEFGDVDRIGNLCLLDKGTNRSYGNSPFPLKVKVITEVDSSHKAYIVPCTKNVFLKYYSGLNINNYQYETEDAEKYEAKISEKITKLLEEANENEI